MNIKIIKIVDEPKYIIVSKFENTYYFYYMNKLDTINKYRDIGMWHCHYKKGLSE